jgi:hypothetical protein
MPPRVRSFLTKATRQPRTAQRTRPDDVDLSVRFMYGVHTIFLIVDPLAPFSKVSHDLLEALREQYPDGLKPSVDAMEPTAIPGADNELETVYALPKSPTDLSRGWKKLDLREGDTPAKKGIKDNAAVAFAFASPDDQGDVSFEVVLPLPPDDDDDMI